MPGRGFTVPPGRSGRLWLQRRLQVAQRGAELLDRKLRILRGETDRLRSAAEQAAVQWERCCADAGRWLQRASLLGGQRAIRLAADGGGTDITVTYRTVMGVRYPAGTSCVIPEPATWDGPVLAGTRLAQRAALEAAVRHAAAAEALRLVEAETLATQRRLRAIRQRWIPRLEEALSQLTLALEEQEIADAARLRLAGSAARKPAQHGAGQR